MLTLDEALNCIFCNSSL